MARATHTADDPVVESDERTVVDTDEQTPAPGAARPLAPGTEWLVQRVHPPLRKMWNRGFRFLFLLDALGLAAIMVATNLVRFRTVGWEGKDVGFFLVGLVAAVSIHLVVNYFFGLYEREPRLGVRAWLPRVLLATAFGVALQALAALVLERYLAPRGNLLVLFLASPVVLIANRRLSRLLAVRRQGPPRVVLVGPAHNIALAEEHLVDSDQGALVVGRVERTADLAAAVAAHRATDVLLLDVHAFETVFPEPLNELEDLGIGFLQRVSARETLLGLQAIHQVAGMPFVRLRSHSVASFKLRFKRLFDLVIVLVTSPIWLLVMGGFALYVLVRDGRPVFYRQTRVGFRGAEFRLIKFRTMVRDAERQGVQLSPGGADPRIVRGLGWMRAMRADELPQMFKVIRGEMSLVGPRPERPELVAEIEARVPGYTLRYELPPGLTGLAQINGRYATDPEYKLGYDLQYMVNWSPVLDLQIMFQTVWVVLARRV
jgi:lipopolysaccharide/colanic/teichoic acid biosynthesis glycosyltransferase